MNSIFYECSLSAKVPPHGAVFDANLDSWERLLSSRDDAQIWKAIDWGGKIDLDRVDENEPTDQQFKEYFEEILNPVDTPNYDYSELETDVSVPILDDPITAWEGSQQAKKLKPNKACGPDGVSPGIFKILPIAWLVTIASLLNTIFHSRIYPSKWAIARFFTIFKRGSRKLVGNYRGISVINSIAKLYDMVLCARLQLWFSPLREQAGCQTGRGCTEHIITLRLLTDLARRKKLKLFITFVDFSQAYDKVPRFKLFSVLKR